MTDMTSQPADTEQQQWTGSPSTHDHEPDPAPGLISCPRCADAVLDLGEHLRTCPEPSTEAEPQTDRVADARRILDEDRQRRMQACLTELEAVLDKHGMRLEVEPARAILVPRD
ncbi:hypothetical protein [Streptomyces dubilierae]|uniref:Uncharacterized protein n=1 Tax=Streptomyces dubilierae TaxID=3075533 RepID=A0ABU2P6N0_9ACTN|nr:hypothetical protein [Streptomyces sp. DSM 41921]MDT0387806.1 hypothetical protein [Streptomyces sp. DSM 41921]